MVSHWGEIDSNSFQVSRTLLNILVDLYNAAVLMVSIFPLISKPSGPFTNPLGIVPSVPSQLVSPSPSFYMDFCWLAGSPCTSLFFFFFLLSFIFPSVVCRDDKDHYLVVSLLFLLTITWSGRLIEIRWSVCISKPQRNLCISMTNYGLGIYHLFVLSNLNLLPKLHFLPHKVLSTLIHFLSWFTVFANCIVNCFVSIITLPTFTILLCLVYFYYNIVGPNGVILCCN